MQLTPEVTTRDVSLTGEQQRLIRKQIEKLDRFYPKIMSCRVVVEGTEGRHQSGGPVHVRIDLTVPGTELVVDRQKGESFQDALHQAFNAMQRQLRQYAEKQRREVKRKEGPPVGIVTQLMQDDGYGFIGTADGREIYFHQNSVLDSGFDKLEVGTQVRFAEEQGEEGPQASTVAPLSS